MIYDSDFGAHPIDDGLCIHPRDFHDNHCVVPLHSTVGVGPRVVVGPVLHDPIDWDPSVSYEALTIVLHEGNSYTSRQFVPIGIDIANEDYWAPTGNYDAQVEQYRRETAQALEAAQGAQSDIDSLLPKTSFTDENTVADALSTLGAMLPAESFTDVTIYDYINQKSNIVTPELYGAVGDGVTDDTYAIRSCILDNPNSKIVFGSKHYLVSDEIICYGSLGGQEIDLGGATIEFDGDVTKPIFSFYDRAQVQNDWYIYNAYQNIPGDAVSKAYIHGGTLIGGSAGIQNCAFHTMIDNVKIENASRAGLIIGSDDFVKSMQTSVSNVLIMRNESVEYWSEEATERLMTLAEVPCGILLLSPDNMFTNVNVNRYAVGVRTVYDGAQFSNCHLTCQYRDAYRSSNNTLALCAGVVLTPPTTTRTGVISLSNMYFDGPKWCVYTTTETRIYVDISASYYFCPDVVDEVSAPVYAYMANQNSLVNVSDFMVRPMVDSMTFIPASAMSYDYNKHPIMKETYLHTFYDGYGELFNAKNLVSNSGDSALVLKPTTSLTTGQEVPFGCILIPGSSVNRCDSFDIELNFRNSLVYKGTIRLTSASATFETEYCHDTISTEAFKIAIGEFDTIDVDGYNFTVAYMYIVPQRSFSNVPMYVTVRRNNTNTLIFLNYGDVIVNDTISNKIGVLTLASTPY